ncbi:hypothetical protein PAECIP111891_06057 [Paenibacillus allorhizoplanae]|uniref:Uncharacterized protein n=1 Tax=Paenibacillus allorhizoplanae TaxID=2905648 RepID=A0ABM9CX16_9BACL|nr:hypothetical protein PAECIP111891_06057 [Paenibacillus allorhizoplanae]
MKYIKKVAYLHAFTNPNQKFVKRLYFCIFERWER